MKQTTARVASRQFHRWLIPEKTVIGIFSLGVIFVFAGAVLCAVSGVAGGALAIIGGILLAVGIILLMICIFLCAHAWCVWYVRDSETQTIDTNVVGADFVDSNYYPTYGFPDKKAPNGVLRDSRTTGSLNKKHVTISPSSHVFSSSPSRHGGQSGHAGQAGQAGQADISQSSGYSTSKGMSSPTHKSGPGSVSSATSTLASFAYLNEPNSATPYSTLNRQNQGQSVHQVPVKVDSSYNSFPRHSDGGRTVQVRPYNADQHHVMHSNVPPTRRHSDDDYDNASEVGPMLSYQTYQPQPAVSQWQQHQHHNQQEQQHQQQQQHQQWQHGGHQSQQQVGFQHSPQPAGYQQSYAWQQSHGQSQQQQAQLPPQSQQQVWQTQPSSQSSWKQVNTSYDEPPPPQRMVHPSAKRPMTFEQISSSKVSLYDNIHMSRVDDEEE